ncbi:MAG TPA: ImmA/IrrE family metallo-endopeptidase [Gemmataceae bacterium]|jgi:HTH-type transcriptional regulator/antitoxin HigA|nr:ImmA/IrrE family metallo-endopeptidase [Gemmataceae bacterium]
MHLAHFWFTLFHEAGHLLNDGNREVFVDVDYAEDPCELAADAFACHLLIPPRHQPELPGLKSRIAVEEFARRIGIHPGIVVGRLQRKGLLPYTHLNGLKVMFEWK